jgi:hypothetical protein
LLRDLLVGVTQFFRAHEAGFDHHVSKPLSIEALGHVLAQVQGGNREKTDEVKE